MNELNTEWEIEKDIENIIDKSDESFEIKTIELVHHHFNSGEKEPGMPISTSVGLLSKIDLETQSVIWLKEITHKYCGIENADSEELESYTEKIDNIEEILAKINSIDLRNLKNNYFTDSVPERYSYWEINYNYLFKIIGTYNNEINEYKELCNILEFKKIIDMELDKIEYKKESNNI